MKFLLKAALKSPIYISFTVCGNIDIDILNAANNGKLLSFWTSMKSDFTFQKKLGIKLSKILQNIPILNNTAMDLKWHGFGNL